MFENDTFLFFENSGVSYLKWTLFCIWNWHIFVFENGRFRILKLHISFLIIRRLRDKVTWNMSIFEMSISEGKEKLRKFEVKVLKLQGFKFEVTNIMGNVNIRNVKFRGGKDKQRKFKVQLSKFQGFKVSNLRWQSNMGNINIWNVSMPNIKCRRQGEGFKKKKNAVKISMWRYEVRFVAIC